MGVVYYFFSIELVIHEKLAVGPVSKREQFAVCSWQWTMHKFGDL